MWVVFVWSEIGLGIFFIFEYWEEGAIILGELVLGFFGLKLTHLSFSSFCQIVMAIWDSPL